MKRLLSCGIAFIALTASGSSGAGTPPVMHVAEASSAAVPGTKALLVADSGKRRITTEQDYRDTIVGRKLTNKHGYVVTEQDGTMVGNFAKTKLKGTWTWEGGYFCRSGVYGKKIFSPDCLTVVVSGNKVTYTRKKGKGKRTIYQMK